jgi:hypothetical protein
MIKIPELITCLELSYSQRFEFIIKIPADTVQGVVIGIVFVLVNNAEVRITQISVDGRSTEHGIFVEK